MKAIYNYNRHEKRDGANHFATDDTNPGLFNLATMLLSITILKKSEYSTGFGSMTILAAFSSYS
jgi:hypothetical protein